jgi:acyl-coenzyme A synthetase/AMP-(fatty) acid ligase
LSLDVIDQIHDYCNADGGLYPPSLLEAICKSQDSLKKMSMLKFVMFSGAPLSQEAGNRLSKVVRVHNTLGSTEVGLFPVFLVEPDNWNYFKFHPYFGHQMEPRGGGRYELVIYRKENLRPFQSIFHVYPNASEYRTRDLFSRHPSKSLLWQYEGRIDDLIILSHGEDLDPISMEGAIRKHALVRFAVIGGHGRDKPYLLIQPTDQPAEKGANKASKVEEIWPAVVEANKLCSEHVQLTKDLIVFTTPDKPLPLTPKGTVDRRRSMEYYKHEINMLY